MGLSNVVVEDWEAFFQRVVMRARHMDVAETPLALMLGYRLLLPRWLFELTWRT